jgi:hypothetical protein
MNLGKDGFAWFIGCVEDRMDPLQLGRVKIRILNFHNELIENINTNDLPWAVVLNGLNASISGKGISPVGLVEGSWVIGFFADPNSYQIPVVLGSINGLNSETIEYLNENYGTGFKDIRNSDALKFFPVDKFEKREFPDGKDASGDKHGLQYKNAQSSENYPRQTYSPDATTRFQGTPDTNILAINDVERLADSIVGLKRKNRTDGGLREIEVLVADCNTPKFNCGVTNESGTNKGTNKGLGVGDNKIESSSYPSRRENYKRFKDKPTNVNGFLVYSNEQVKDCNNG